MCIGIKLEDRIQDLFHSEIPLKSNENNSKETFFFKVKPRKSSATIKIEFWDWKPGKSGKMTSGSLVRPVTKKIRRSLRNSKKGLKCHLILNWDEKSRFSPNPKLGKCQCCLLQRFWKLFPGPPCHLGTLLQMQILELVHTSESKTLCFNKPHTMQEI